VVVTQRQARGVDLAAADACAAPLVHVLRDERVESIHRGHVAVVDAQGNLLAWAGEPRALVFPRSAFKPFQALPLVESGAFARSGLGTDALALIAGSHSGTDRHAALARTILAAAHADETMLRCGVHPPYDDATAERLRLAHEDPTPVRHNCSGKHAGMLLLARFLGAPLDTYADPDHPVQRRIFDRFATLLGEPWTDPEPAIDGCSAPTPRMPLATLARAFALLATGRDAEGAPVPALAQIRDAMQEHPELVAGPGRLDTLLMRAVPSAVAKAGAEAVHAIGLVDRGVGIAVKVEDGTRRALGPAVTSVLEALGVLGPVERGALAQHAGERLRNAAGLEVGLIRGVARLEGEALR
jgi:L-asparaginase II